MRLFYSLIFISWRKINNLSTNHYNSSIHPNLPLSFTYTPPNHHKDSTIESIFHINSFCPHLSLLLNLLYTFILISSSSPFQIHFLLPSRASKKCYKLIEPFQPKAPINKLCSHPSPITSLYDSNWPISLLQNIHE